MSNKVNWLITDQNVTVNYQGQTHIVKRTDVLADELIRAIKEDRQTDIPNLVSVAKAMENKSKGNVVVKDGEIFVKDIRVPAELARKIQKFIDEKLPYQPLVKFAENLQGNPSFRAVNELFQFLEKNDHPLTENGNFIAYRKVRSDFKDGHTGTMDNSVGKVVEMPRNQVNEDATQTCSNGLHVANWDYAHNIYSAGPDAIVLEVEVNPGDVVAVPVDYQQSKMRVCRFKVLGVVTQPHEDGVQLRVTKPDDGSEDHQGREFCYQCDTWTTVVVGGVCSVCDERDEEYYCQDCGEVCEAGYELCQECEDKDYCVECGEECENGYEVCLACEQEAEKEECESCGGNHQDCDGPETDRYPYEDELEEEEE